jgi:hypothetical protein
MVNEEELEQVLQQSKKTTIDAAQSKSFTSAAYKLCRNGKKDGTRIFPC